jgi:hypothetical protein
VAPLINLARSTDFLIATTPPGQLNLSLIQFCFAALPNDLIIDTCLTSAPMEQNSGIE